MPAGFQCFAQDGSNVAQIDSDIGLSNSQLRQKITQTLVFGGFPVYKIFDNTQYHSQGFQTTFTFTAKIPLLVLECPNGYCVPMTWTQSRSNWSVIVLGSAGVPVTCYVFDDVSAIPGTSNFGLQVFNAQGVLVADVTKPFARIVGSNQGNPKYAVGSTGYTTDGGTWPVAQGSKSYPVQQRVGIACVQPAFGTGGTSGGASNAGVVVSTFNTSGGTISQQMTMFGDTSNFNNYTGFKEALTWSYLAVDLSFP